MYSYHYYVDIFYFSFVGRATNSEFTLDRIKSTTDIFTRLESRQNCSVAEFTAALDLRATKYGKVSDYILYVDIIIELLLIVSNTITI